MYTLRTIFALLLLQLSFPAVAQQGIRAEVSVDSTRILIGGRFNVTYRFTVPAGQVIVMPPIDSAQHFEVVGRPQTDTIDNGNEQIITTRYTLTSFDSGHWVLPAFTVANGVQTDTVPVDIIFSDFNPDQPYHDITDPEVVPLPPKKKNDWWFYLAGLAFLLLLLIAYLRNRKKPVAKPAAPIARRDPYQAAMLALDQLRGHQDPAKIYFTALTAIFRQYVFERTGIRSPQETTADLVQQLKKRSVPPDVYQLLSQTLQLCDSVKFAKFIPDAQDAEHARQSLIRAIDLLEKDYLTSEQKL